MYRQMLKSKIHRATVTDANLNYVGSITIDEDLLIKAKILENEKVLVVNVNNGERFETYVIKGDSGSGNICLNGAAARLAHVGDTVIIIAFGIYEEHELKEYKPLVVHVDANNKANGTVNELVSE